MIISIMMLFFKVSNFNEFFLKNRKSSQIAIFGSIARNIEG
jgi:predicted nucleotidyltransferase